MPRRLGFLLAVVASLSGSAPAGAQTLPLKVIGTGQLTASTTQGDLRGTVLDDRGQPLAGVVVSAVGATSIFAVSDVDGGFVLRHLPAGAYLLRAHLRGYAPLRGKLVQINQPTQQVGVIALTRAAATSKSEQPKVLEAGLGTSGTAGEEAPPAAAEPDTHDHGEVAWRLRHARRSVLKEAEYEFGGGTVDADPFDSVTRVVGSPARLASALFADLALNGQINLLTRTNFERPEDLLSFEGGAPRGITYVSLSAPTRGGQWSMRGAMTQGDVSSWILSGAFVRQGDVAHRYEAGLSYGTQRYLGGNADAFTAVSEGARNVGAVYAYDRWTVSPRITLAYGGKYARYDYLTDRGLLSPMAAVTLAPVQGDSLRIHAAASRREVAPGAEEFLPPSTGLWLPPERTFSPITRGAGLTPERVDHVEVSAEREWFGEVVIGVRAFRESVNDQIVTMFGVASSSATPSIGHYYVGSGGDVDATGWGVGVSRAIGESLRASVDYTYADALWAGSSPDERRLRRIAASAVRSDSEVIHDLTASVESEVPTTATRVLVIYKVNSAFAVPGTSTDARASARFAVQVNQALPFMNFANAQWEMLIAVRSLFSDDFRDGSVYDELLVVRPPKRFVGGLTVRF